MCKSKFDDYKEKFKKLEKDNFAIMNLKEDESVVHCIDDTDEKYYQFRWAITNKGRMWSLHQKRWMLPRKENGYWRIENIYVHEWVDHYFMNDEEKNMKRMVEEHNKKCIDSEKLKLEVHHKKLVQEMDSSKMTNDERVEACMQENYKENLILQIEGDHNDVHKIMKGKRKLGIDKKGKERMLEFDAMTSILINSGASVHFSYDVTGKKELTTKLVLPTLTAEEEKEYAKILMPKTENHKSVNVN